MADQRVVAAVQLVDPDTVTQIAAVDASGHLQVDIAASSVTVTVTDDGAFNLAANSGVDIGDVDVTSVIPGTGATNLGKAEDVAHTTGDVGVMALGVRQDSLAALAGTTGDYSPLSVNASGALYIQEGSALNVSAATVTVDSELPAAAALADNAANPTTPTVGAALLGFDGTTWDRIYTVADGDAVAAGTKGFLILGTDGANYQALATDSSGNLQVDVLTGGGADAPTNPNNDTATSAALAAGSSANLQSDEFDGVTEKLSKAIFWSSVPYKVELQSVDVGGGGTVTLAYGGGAAGQLCVLEPRHRNYWSTAFATNAGFNGYRGVITNLHPEDAADVYGTFQTED